MKSTGLDSHRNRSQFQVLGTVIPAVSQDLPVFIPCKEVDPADNGLTDKIQLTVIPELIFGTHAANV